MKKVLFGASAVLLAIAMTGDNAKADGLKLGVCNRSTLCSAGVVQFEEATDFPQGPFMEPDGANVTMVTNGSQKLNDKAVQFSGSNYLWAASGGIFGPSFTVAVWIHPTALGSANQVQVLLSEDGDNGYGNSIYLKNVAGSLVATVNIRDGIDPKAGTAVTATTTGDISRNAWHLLIVRARPKLDYNAATWDGELSIMVDNGAAVTTVIQKPLNSGGGRLFLGKSNIKGSEDYFTGYMDQLAVDSSRWTLDETAFYWNGGAGLQYPFVTGNTSYTTPTSHWRFGRVSPRMIDDASGANDAAVSGGTVTLGNTGPFGYFADFNAGFASASAAAFYVQSLSPTLWLRADSIAGLSDGNAVTTWADQSGNGRDFTQGTAGNKPTYKTGIVNGKPVVRFDGTTDYMAGPVLNQVITAATNTVLTVFVKTGAGNGFLHGDSGTGHFGLDFFTGSAFRPRYDCGNVATDAVSLSTPYIGTEWHSGGNLYGGTNDTRTSSLTSVACGNLALLTDTMQIGGTGSAGSFAGDIAEIIVFNSALSETNRQNVENYLAAKYGITIPYVFVQNANQNLHTDNRAFTVDGWFKVSSASTTQGLVANRSGSNGWKVWLDGATSKLQFGWGDGTTNVTLADTTTIVAGTWYYFVARHDGASSFKISVNGTSGGSTTNAIDSTNSDLFYFGTTDDGTSNKLTGSLSGVGWYKGSNLSDVEVALHYNSGSGRECCPVK